ncbi:TOBE domain-containing protein, partial [Exiguobacterium chiriqhucha]|uniref:TOBE domain-containing protein n=1 Tax=Exiguobacterium chiriqhucha TaxID=1385984 RepID=UPI0023F190DC
ADGQVAHPVHLRLRILDLAPGHGVARDFHDEGMHVLVGGEEINVPEGKMKGLRDRGYVGKELVLGIRPESIHDEPIYIDSPTTHTFRTHIDVAELMGAESYLYAELGGHQFTARIDGRSNIHMGDDVTLALDMTKAHFFDTETELVIR